MILPSARTFVRGFSPSSIDRGKDLSAIITTEVPGRNATTLVGALRQRGINTSASLGAFAVIDMAGKNVRSALRISPHYYNTEAELDVPIDNRKSLPVKEAAS